MTEKQSSVTAVAAQNQQRRLSFIGDLADSGSDHDGNKKRQSIVSQQQQQQQPGTSSTYSSERRQSILWNSTAGGTSTGGLPRKSVYQRRMSYALSQVESIEITNCAKNFDGPF